MTPERTNNVQVLGQRVSSESQVKKCLDSAFAALVERNVRQGEDAECVKDDQIKLINGEYNDLLDREMPKTAYERALTKNTTSPYSGKGNSTHPSSSNKSPLNEYYDYPLANSKVTSGSSQRSSFDGSCYTLNQSDHYFAKDRYSVADIMNEERSPSKISGVG